MPASRQLHPALTWQALMWMVLSGPSASAEKHQENVPLHELLVEREDAWMLAADLWISKAEMRFLAEMATYIRAFSPNSPV